MEAKKSNYIRLLGNHIYPTYQLFAIMDNNKTDVHDGLRIAALTVIEWLRQRIGTDIPDELQLQGPEEYEKTCASDLKPLHINRGYSVDIATLPDRSDAFWSLQIIEPDLGSNPGSAQQSRSAVPGRVIETNIGFRICDDELECGFQTVVSDPEGAEEAEVYRLAVVRRLLENPSFGLRQIHTLQDKFTKLETAASVRKLMTLMNDEKNQLPSVVFTYAVPEENKPEQEKKPQSIAQAIAGFSAIPQQSFKAIPIVEIKNEIPQKEQTGKKPPMYRPSKKQNDVPAEPEFTIKEKEKREAILPFDAKEFARHNKACCRTYVLNADLLDVLKTETKLDFKDGDIVVLYPKKHGEENEVIRSTPTQPVRERRLNALSAKLYAYPRGRDYDFGRIHFQAQAKDSIYEARRLALQKTEALTEDNRVYVDKLRAEHKKEIQEKDETIERLQRQLENYKQQEKAWQSEKEKLQTEHQRELDDLRGKIQERDERFGSIERRKTYPKQLTEIFKWAQKKYPEHLVMYEKTEKKLAESGSQVSPELVCDAIDFLANDYWEYHFGLIDENEMNRRCNMKYGRPFDVVPIGDMTVKFAPLEYKVKYLMTGTEKRREYPVTMHLRICNDSQWLLRIYFLFDDAGKKLIIGSLPDHLTCVSIN